MARTLFPEWAKENEPTKYPFAPRATLANDAGRVLVEGTFLDAALYPVGAGAGLYLASAAVDYRTVVLTLASPGVPSLATAEVDTTAPPDRVEFRDRYGRPAGVLLTEGRRLGLFQTWGTGVHEFRREQTEFCASCVFPTPEVGLRGVRLPSGDVLTGDVWLVGDDGVVLRVFDEYKPVPGADPVAVTVVRVDVVGDPLFRRRLCGPAGLFVTPRFVRRLRVVGPNMTADLTPDAGGGVTLTADDTLAADTVLRLRTTAGGIEIAAVGSAAAG